MENVYQVGERVYQLYDKVVYNPLIQSLMQYYTAFLSKSLADAATSISNGKSTSSLSFHLFNNSDGLHWDVELTHDDHLPPKKYRINNESTPIKIN